jgi:hypothetical protein
MERPTKHWFVTVAVVCGLLGLAVGSWSSPADAQDAGQTVRFGVWEIAVTGTETRDTIPAGGEIVRARGTYLVVFLTVENSGNAPEYFYSGDFLVTDDGGTSFSADSEATIAYQIYVLDEDAGDYQPGFAYETAVVFDVPAEASGFVLTSRDRSFIVDLELALGTPADGAGSPTPLSDGADADALSTAVADLQTRVAELEERVATIEAGPAGDAGASGTRGPEPTALPTVTPVPEVGLPEPTATPVT